jgi:hypothetical protein
MPKEWACKSYRAWKKLPEFRVIRRAQSRPAFRLPLALQTRRAEPRASGRRYGRTGGESAIPCGPFPTAIRLISRWSDSAMTVTTLAWRFET